MSLAVVGCNYCISPADGGPYVCAYHTHRQKLEKVNYTQSVVRRIKTELKIDDILYFITFTSCDVSPKELVKNYNRFRKKKNIIIRQSCLELTQNGLPHIHMLVESAKYMDYRMLVRANRGARIDSQKVKSKKAVMEYIAKQRTKPPPEYMELWKEFLKDFYPVIHPPSTPAKEINSLE